MDKMSLQPEITTRTLATSLAHSGDPMKLLEQLPEQIFGLFSATRSTLTEDEKNRMIQAARSTATRLANHVSHGTKDFSKKVADRVATLLPTLFDRARSEGEESLVCLSQHLVDLHGVASQRFLDEPIL